MKKKLLIGGLLVAAILVTTGIVVAGVNIAEASAKSHSAQRDVIYDSPGAQQSEHRSKPYIGIAIRALPQDSEANGALIARVVEGSPADGSLQVDDIITAIDGESVDMPSDVLRIVRERSPGDAIILTVARGGASMDISITLGERPVSDYQGKGGKWRGKHKFNPFGKAAESFVLSNTRYMTDDGVKTVRRAAGTVQNINGSAATFDLLLRDGSDTLSFTVDDDTKILTDVDEGETSLSDLSTDATTMVLQVTHPDGTSRVQSVVQGELSLMLHSILERHGFDKTPRVGQGDSDGFSPRRFFFRWFSDNDSNGNERRGRGYD